MRGSVFSRVRLWSETSFRLRHWLVGVAGVVLLGGIGSRFMTTGEPTSGGRAESGDARVPWAAEEPRLAEGVDELERKAQHLAKAGVGGEEVVALLEQAIRLQHDRLRRNPHAGLEQNLRLERLESARDNERAKMASARVAILEQAAADARQSGDAEAALAPLRAALATQREVNNSNADAAVKSFAREMALAQAVESTEAEPRHRALQAALEAARAASADRRWADAVAALAVAREVQRELNQQYSRTRFADLVGLDAIEAEIASLAAAGTAAGIDAAERAADAAAELGRTEEAAGLYDVAADRQRELNAQFARSRFFSSQRVESLQVKRQTVLAVEGLAAAAALDRAAADALLKRQVRAAEERILQAAELLERVEKHFPKALNFDGALKIKLAFLGAKRADLRAWQDRVYGRLAPVPAAGDLMMMTTEVPQELYAQVMSTNPSRHDGPALPVDSVNWHDAQEFCRRLSWVLGTRVRLPTTGEFRAAAADGDAAVWSSENAHGHSQQTGLRTANSAGFFDLAGNLAEWLEADGGDAANAPVAGGSYLDPAEGLGHVMLVPTAKIERARHVGFRVVVEFPLE